MECFEIPCKSALWSVADTACCVLLHLQPHHAVCYSHTTLWPVTATSHHGLLPPHHVVCYSHTDHGLLPPHNVACNSHIMQSVTATSHWVHYSPVMGPVADTSHCGLLQPHPDVDCYSHILMLTAIATSHCGLLQPHHDADCYSHITLPKNWLHILQVICCICHHVTSRFFQNCFLSS